MGVTLSRYFSESLLALGLEFWKSIVQIVLKTTQLGKVELNYKLHMVNINIVPNVKVEAKSLGFESLGLSLNYILSLK